MATVGNLVANLSMNTTGFSRGTKRASGLLNSLHRSVTGTVSKITGAFGGLAGIGALVGGALSVRGAVGAIEEQIAAERKLGAVLKATGGAAGLSADAIMELASSRQAVTNFGDEATIAAAAVLATFKEIKGDVFRESITAIQDMSSVLGTDMQGSAIQLGKALNDPIRGVSALSRVGVSFTEQQREQIRTMQESGDIMGAQGVILAELKGEFGGAAEAMATPMAQLKNTLGDVAESVGALLLPALNAGAEALRGWLEPIASARGALTEWGETAAMAFRNLGSIVKITGLDMAITFLEAVPMLEKPIQEIAAFYRGHFAGLGAFFKSWVQNIIAGFQEIKNFALAVIEGIKAAFNSIKAGDFRGAGGAFSSAFMETLATQTDMKSAGNPFKNYLVAFKDAQAELRGDFEEGGGLTNILKTQKQSLLDDIAASELTRATAVAAKVAKTFTSTTAQELQQIKLPVKLDTQDTKLGPVGAFEKGSKEAFSAIQAAIRGTSSSSDPQSKTAKNTEKTNQLLQQQIDMMKGPAAGLDINIQGI